MKSHLRVAVLIGLLPACMGAPPQQPRVRPGIDMLLADSAHLIAGRRLGLITNQSGVDARGVPTIDRLAAGSGYRLVALFAPEHGIRGTAAPGETINDTLDAATGVPIYSLYGANRAPTRAQLARLDVLLVDLQDVGARTYTYISTVVHAMRAAHAAGTRVVVLDRPNPIGCAVQGPVLDTANASFIGMLPVPLRHGMTMGEMARFANGVFAIGADLVVVPVSGWRCEWLDATGLPWVRPSPNLGDLEAVAWFPGTVLFEATNLSVGRGTDAAFRQVGAPWLHIPAEHLPGGPWRYMFERVEFTPVRPGDGKYDGRRCVGRLFPTLDRRAGDPIAEALRTLVVLQAANADSFRVDARGMALRLGVRWRDGGPDTTAWAAGRARFRAAVQPYLLYTR